MTQAFHAWLAGLTLGAALLAGPAIANPSLTAVSDDALVGMVERNMDRLFQRLNVTPEQKTKFMAIRDRHHTATKAVRERLFERRKALFTLMKRADATREQAQTLQREVNSLQNQLAEARLAAWFDGRALLSPEQLKQLEAMPTKAHARTQGERRGHRAERR